MKSLYIASIENYSGKTGVCLGLGKRFQADGYKVGYLKPLSQQPWQVGDQVADEDAAFVKTVLNLPAQPWELSPVVVTATFLNELLQNEPPVDLMEKVKAAAAQAGAGQDILLLEGGSSMREGHVARLPSVAVAAALSDSVLMVVKYADDVQILDDILAARERIPQILSGVLINRVPAQAAGFVEARVVPFLENHNIPVFGVLPEVRGLSALTVEELVQVLDAEVQTKYYRPQAVVENLSVGAMTAETALNRFRKYSHKAVITGGDRTDIQLAALETSTTCLILTGHLHPSPLVLRQAEQFGVSVLLVRSNTMETIEKIESIYGKTRLGHAAKLRQFQTLLDEHVNYPRLYGAIGLT